MKLQLVTRAARFLHSTRNTLVLLSTLTLASLSIAGAAHANELTGDGLYLRGSIPEADAVGEQYMVFEIQDSEVVGGFYQPHSSFACFHGSIGGDYMPLTVLDSYSSATYQYAMNLSEDTIVANAQQATVVPRDPAGAYAIANVSETARQVLASCQDHLTGTGAI